MLKLANSRLELRGCVAGLLLLCLWCASSGKAATTASLRRTAIVAAVEAARPSVVNIHGRKTVRSDRGEITSNSEGFKQVNGMGTGVVIDERGYIITNYHVVDGVQRIQVTTASRKSADGRSVESRTVMGRLVAHDPATDLAVIKIDADDPLSVIQIGTSSDLMWGEPVIAIGNAYGYEHTVTRGIISALHRPVQVSDNQKYQDLIQTDASINPGNSGGPLLNIEGAMIGINVAVRVGAQGIGFAVPVDQAMEVAARLLEKEVSQYVRHGVTGKTSSSQYVVSSVAAESPADRAGLQPGDVITAAGGQRVERALDFGRAMLDRRAGDELQLSVQREDAQRTLTLALAAAGQRRQPSSAEAWTVLGLRLVPVSQRVFQQMKSRYNGGLKVVAVRSNSPAAKQGIRYGDILVGVHKWETVSRENIAYILESDEFRRAQPVKFYILRNGETLFGHLQVAAVGD